ncbi:MAG: hypothetical protein JWQ81_3219 [Amycolatopsis sp.]|nr:hypothetical protein [Amycolatopsis sp.]
MGTLRARRNLAPTEMLDAPSSLDAWFRVSGVVKGSTNSQLSDLPKAIELREAIYSLVAARLTKDDYDESAFAVLNRAARAAPVVPQLTPAGLRLDGTSEQALSSVARAAIDILSGPDKELLKECGRPECTQVYLDRSHGFRREWCAMKTCDNKMKAAAYRACQRGNPPLSTSRA